MVKFRLPVFCGPQIGDSLLYKKSLLEFNLGNLCKLLPIPIGWQKKSTRYELTSIKVLVANFTLHSSVHLLRENTDLVRSNQRISPTAPSEPLKLIGWQLMNSCRYTFSCYRTSLSPVFHMWYCLTIAIVALGLPELLKHCQHKFPDAA
ncbi:hypothetical protein Tco_0500473 [Tanacetum coccineum]